MDKRILANNYQKKPLWFRSLNQIWRKTYPVGTRIKLSKDRLIKKARETTGLENLGKDFWDEPLDRMLDSINHESELHPIGRFITQKRLENLLAIRLRSEWWFKKHPEILEQSLYPILLIIGLQRTGTTKLHRLLAADPNIRSLRSWEAINPAPLNGQLYESRLRINQAKLSEKALKLMAPDFFAIHPVEHMEPEEDILLLDVSFMSTTTEATMHVPSYASWLEKTDQSKAYAYAVKLLKLLQFQRPAKWWVLKSPHHLEFLHLTDNYFGNVKYLWTHRDVYECIPSFISMMVHSRSIFSDVVDPDQVVNHWLRKNGYMLNKALDFRNSKPLQNHFTDIYYDQFITDPNLTINRIYKKIIKNTPGLSQLTNQLSSDDHKAKYGHHIYSINDFGLTKSMIDEYTHIYQKFIIEITDNHANLGENE